MAEYSFFYKVTDLRPATLLKNRFDSNSFEFRVNLRNFKNSFFIEYLLRQKGNKIYRAITMITKISHNVINRYKLNLAKN